MTITTFLTLNIPTMKVGSRSSTIWRMPMLCYLSHRQKKVAPPRLLVPHSWLRYIFTRHTIRMMPTAIRLPASAMPTCRRWWNIPIPPSMQVMAWSPTCLTTSVLRSNTRMARKASGPSSTRRTMAPFMAT